MQSRDYSTFKLEEFRNKEAYRSISDGKKELDIDRSYISYLLSNHKIAEKTYRVATILISSTVLLYYITLCTRRGRIRGTLMALYLTLVLLITVELALAGEDCSCTVYVGGKIYCSHGCYLAHTEDACCTSKGKDCEACWAFWMPWSASGCPDHCLWEGNEERNSTNGGIKGTSSVSTTTAPARHSWTKAIQDAIDKDESAKNKKSSPLLSAIKSEVSTARRRGKRAAVDMPEENHPGEKILELCGKLTIMNIKDIELLIDESMLRLYLVTPHHDNDKKVQHCIAFDDVCGNTDGINSTLYASNFRKPLYYDHDRCDVVRKQTDPYFINVDSPNVDRICILRDTEGMLDLPVLSIAGYTVRAPNACKLTPREISDCDTSIQMKNSELCIVAKSEEKRISYFQINYHSFTDNIKFVGFLERCLSLLEVNKNVIHGSCNTNNFRYNIDISRKDMCLSIYPAAWSKIPRAYCSNEGLFKANLIIFIILMCFVIAFEIISIILCVVYASVKGSIPFRSPKLFVRTCAVCGITLPYFSKMDHICSNKCYRCGKQFRTVKDAREHAIDCKNDYKNKETKPDSPAKLIVIKGWTDMIVKVFRQLFLIIFLIMLSHMCVEIANAETIDDNHVCKTVPDVEMIGGVRYSIETSQKDKVCDKDGSCRANIVVTGTMRAQSKTVQSWTAIGTDDLEDYIITIAINNIVEKCTLLPQYWVCDNIIKSDYAHSCVGEGVLWDRMSGDYYGRSLRYELVSGKSCKITKNVKELWKPHLYFLKSAANTWCNTCVTRSWDAYACWNERTTSPCEQVSVKKGCKYELDVTVLSAGTCQNKKITLGDTIGDFKFQPLTNSPGSEGQVVLETNQQLLKKGPINALGEYSNKYGAIQWLPCQGVIPPNETGTVHCEDGSTFVARTSAGEDTLCANSQDPATSHRRDFDCENHKVKIAQCLIETTVTKDHLYDAGVINIKGSSEEEVRVDVGAVQFQYQIDNVEIVKRRSKRDVSNFDEMSVSSIGCVCLGFENREASSKCMVTVSAARPMTLELECPSSEIYIPNGIILAAEGRAEYAIHAEVGYPKISNCTLSGIQVDCVVETTTYVPAFISHLGVESLPSSTAGVSFWDSVVSFFVSIWRGVYSFFSSAWNLGKFLILLLLIVIAFIIYRLFRGKPLPGGVYPAQIYRDLSKSDTYAITSTGQRVQVVRRNRPEQGML